MSDSFKYRHKTYSTIGPDIIAWANKETNKKDVDNDH